MVRHNGNAMSDSVTTPEPADPASAPGGQAVPEEVDDFSWRQVFRDSPRWLRGTAYTLLALVVLLSLLCVAAVVVLRNSLPHVDGNVDVPGLAAPVEVLRDEHGIPQVYADTDADLMLAQGYVHAQERFFEMDLRRMATAGRLSEVFGEKTLASDKLVRTMGWRRVAEREWALLAPDTRKALTAYSAGVNAYLDERGAVDLAPEYALLRLTGVDHHPEEWTPVDSLSWLKAMAWDLRGNMEEEIDRVLLSLDHDDDEIAELYPDYDFEARPPIVGTGTVFGPRGAGVRPTAGAGAGAGALPGAAARALGDVRGSLGQVQTLLGRGEGLGSNSWVVSGSRTTTGKPILANDPHLGVSQPGVWMQMGLHCRQLSSECTIDSSGFTFSGVPGVIIGHNDRIAWGFTNLNPDVTDLFLEQTEGDDNWIQDGKRLPLQVRTETVRVRGADDFELRIRESEHGPLISDVSGEYATVGANARTDEPGVRGNGYAVALAWTALTPSRTADAILGINRARDWQEFRAAAADFAVPAQNLVYADVDGHIGYQAPGLVPIRRRGNDGRAPVEGWLSRNDWTGRYVPYEELPSVLDPEEGFVVTANQAVTGPDYPWFLSDDFDAGYRSTRIREVLEQPGRVSVEDMAALQLDSTNPMARTLVPYLLDIDLPRGYASAGQRLLEGWDLTQPADSAPAAYFNAVWRSLLARTFHDQLRQRTWLSGGSRSFQVVSALLEDPTSHWWDDVTTEEVETRDDILAAALVEARDDLTRRRSLDPAGWSWGHLHRLDLVHSSLGSSGNPLLERLFNRTGYEVGGGSSLVDASNWDAGVGYEVTLAPSMRMVVDLADLDASRWINLTGVSGHPLSAHYADQTELYVRGRTLPWAYGRDAVEAATRDTLTLRPADG